MPCQINVSLACHWDVKHAKIIVLVVCYNSQATNRVRLCLMASLSQRNIALTEGPIPDRKDCNLSQRKHHNSTFSLIWPLGVLIIFCSLIFWLVVHFNSELAKAITSPVSIAWSPIYFWQNKDLLRRAADGRGDDDLSRGPLVDDTRRWLSETTCNKHSIVMTEGEQMDTLGVNPLDHLLTVKSPTVPDVDCWHLT